MNRIENSIIEMKWVDEGVTGTHLFTTPVVIIPTTNFFAPFPLSIKFSIKILIRDAFESLLGLSRGRPTSPR